MMYGPLAKAIDELVGAIHRADRRGSTKERSSDSHEVRSAWGNVTQAQDDLIKDVKSGRFSED